MSCCNSNCNHDPCGSSFNQSVTKAAQYAQYAQTQANAAAASLAEFNEKYLGAFAEAPAGPHDTGALYWNLGNNTMYVWDGTSWIANGNFNEFTNFSLPSETALGVANFVTGQEYEIVTVGDTNWTGIGAASATVGVRFTKNAVAATGTGTARITRDLVTRFADVVNVKDFGAVGDWNGTTGTDDTLAVQAAIDYAQSSNKGTVFIPDGMKILIDSNNLTIPSRVRIISNNLSHTFPAAPTLAFKGTCIFLNPLYTIKITGNGCGITGINILRKGAERSATAPASYAGTAITIQPLVTPGNADDCYIANCGIFGFTQAIYGNWCGRYTFENIVGDNTNGIFTENIYDVGRVRNVHFWPFLTSSYSGSSYRNGTAFFIQTANDWSEYSNCFSYGYENGFKIRASTVRLVNCGSDGLVNNSTTSKGYNIEGFNDVMLIGCRAAARRTNFYIDTGNQVFLQNCAAWGATYKHIHVVKGTVLMDGCHIYDPVVDDAVTIDSGITRVVISNTLFRDLGANVFNIDPAVKLRAHILESCQFINSTVDQATKRMVSFSDSGFSKYAIAFNGYQDRRYYANGTSLAPTAMLANQQFFQLLSYGHDGTDFRQSSNFRSECQIDATANVVPSRFVISTEDNLGVYADRFSFGYTSIFPTTDNTYQLGTNGFRWSAVWVANGNIQPSDERLKKDIEDSKLGLDFIKSLHPVSYKWIEGGKKIIRQVFLDKDGNEIPEGEPIPDGATPGRIIEESVPGNRTHFGLLSQEVKAALPDGVDFGGWVLTDKDDPDSRQALRYDQFIAPLIKAIQEQQKQIEELSAKVVALESK